MTDEPFFIDAGPSLNFFATNNQGILFATAKNGLHAPQAVQDEVFRKAEQLPGKFGQAKRNWQRCIDRITVVPGDRTPRRDALAKRFTQRMLPDLPSKQKHLGETFVVITRWNGRSTARSASC